MVRRAVLLHDATVATSGQPCDTCPVDITQEECLRCEGGSDPVVEAGYIMVQYENESVPVTESNRRRALGQKPSKMTTVFRCHIEMDIAKKRCPANPAVPGTCMPGYKGSLCSSCVENYGMSPSRECEPCDDTGYTSKSFLILFSILVAIVILAVAGAKIWQAYTLKHLARSSFQPMRIMVTYSQVTSQLGGEHHSFPSYGHRVFSSAFI
jgi:hypothetical protein